MSHLPLPDDADRRGGSLQATAGARARVVSSDSRHSKFCAFWVRTRRFPPPTPISPSHQSSRWLILRQSRHGWRERFLKPVIGISDHDICKHTLPYFPRFTSFLSLLRRFFTIFACFESIDAFFHHSREETDFLKISSFLCIFCRVCTFSEIYRTRFPLLPRHLSHPSS